MAASTDPWDTPMMRQFRSMKQEHPGAVLFFRMGDFYETFGDDAKVVATTLGITLTTRQGLPLAGIPHHALEGYLSRMVRAGHRVAICDQVEDPRKAKGLVKRAVTRVVTPGTVIEEPMLRADSPNHLVSLFAPSEVGATVGLAVMDVSTGQALCADLDPAAVPAELARLRPAELLVPSSWRSRLPLLVGAEPEGTFLTPYEDQSLSAAEVAAILKTATGAKELGPLGLTADEPAAGAAAALLRYVRENAKGSLYLAGISRYTTDRHLRLDRSTQRTLELVANTRDGGREGTVLEVLDRTATPMGARLLRQWLLQPLAELPPLQARHDAVESLLALSPTHHVLDSQLRQVQDLPRLLSRISYGSANARTLLAVLRTLQVVPQLRTALGVQRGRLAQLADRLQADPAMSQLLAKALVEDPPTTTTEGGMIAPGFDAALDTLVAQSAQAREWIATLEARERERTGIRTLRVGYNRVFGYYLEVSRSQQGSVPPEYVRKQTVAAAERYVTAELTQYEEVVLSADERINARQLEVFEALRGQVREGTTALLELAEAIAELDALRSFARVAAEQRYVRPSMHEGTALHIEAGRHPVLERALPAGTFVANDIALDTTDRQVMVLTGPNMAGKSTYLRQVALCVLLAQAGAFVPAKAASIGLVDRIYTRVGAADDLYRGQSTFMVEMMETAQILNTASRRSLVLLDEVGRGTSTFDGLAIAWAVVEYLHDTPQLGAKTIFATHYHQLTELAQSLPRVFNAHLPVAERGDELVFLRRVEEGSVDRSYGIAVAQLAGVPRAVVDRAKEVLASIEEENLAILALMERTGAVTPAAESESATPPVAAAHRRRRKGPSVLPAKGSARFTQLSLFSGEQEGHPVLERLRGLDLSSLTPLEALNLLAEVQAELRAQERRAEGISDVLKR